MNTALKNTTSLTPMLAGPAPRAAAIPMQMVRLFEGESDADKAAREAKEAADKEAADKAAAETAEAERIAAEKTEADRVAAEKAQLEADRKAGKLTDKEFELLTDMMKHKAAAKDAKKAAADAQAALKAYEGIDPVKVRALIAEQERTQKAKEDADRKAAEASGDVERIKKMMADDHAKIVGEKDAEIATAKSDLTKAQQTINDLTVGAAFSTSNYISDELVLTSQIARQVYGPYFDVVDGKIQPFDKPRGEKDRTPLLTADGKAVSFDEAVKKIIEASPDKDRLLKSKLAPGAHSRTTPTTVKKVEAEEGPRGASRISAALAARNQKA